jgi:hypothetical protein
VVVLLIAALVAAPHPARGTPKAQQDPVAQEVLSEADLRERVDAYLGTIDRPIPAERWKALGPPAAPLLEAIIADENSYPSRRAKAVDALVLVSPDKASQVVGGLARDESKPLALRVAAMHGAAQVLSPSQAVSALRPVLRGSQDMGVRAVAADVIARKQGGCAEVKSQVQREKAENRPAFERALKRCGE